MQLKEASTMSTYPVGSLMKGKKGLVMGVANDKSIGWGIAQALHAQGATVGFTYQSEILQKRVEPLAQTLSQSKIFECDVADDTSLDRCFDEIEKEYGTLDFIVHSIAFSDKNELKGKFLNTSRANFANTMDVSCFSLVAVAKRAEKLMKNGGSILTLTYHGARKAFPNYNAMGVAKAALEASVRYLACDMGPDNIRVNAISAGTVRTLAASGISDFRNMQKFSEKASPLRRNVSLENIGGAAVYLLSDLGNGTTGEILYVDSGFNIVGMSAAAFENEDGA